MSRPGTGNQRAVVRDAVLRVGLRRRHLVVAAEHQLLVDDVEDRVGAPVRQIGRAAARPRAAAPLVGEDDLRAVVVERGRVPVGEVLVRSRDRAASGCTGSEMSSRMPLPEHAPAASPSSGKTVMSWHWLVVLVRCVPGPWSPPVQRPAMAPVFASAKMRGRLTIARLLGRGERHFDHVDAEERGVRVLLRIAARAAGELFARAHAAGARAVDVDASTCPSGRSPACACASRGRSAPPPPARGLRDVADVEDAHAAEAFLAHRCRRRPACRSRCGRASARPT